MSYAFIYDTETTGLVDSRMPHDHPCQPYLVQLGCLLLDLDNDFKEVASLDLIVKPHGYKTMPEKAFEAHGISYEMAERVGVPLVVACAAFTNLRAVADECVAHNANFDFIVMNAAIHRTGKNPAKDWPARRLCTMEQSLALVGLPPTRKMRAAGFNKFKPPNLTELHEFLFGEDFEDAHSALADARACARCFKELRRTNQI